MESITAAIAVIASTIGQLTGGLPEPPRHDTARPAGVEAHPPEGWVLPIPGSIVRAFEPPAQRWLAGHRGVDIVAPPGTPVRAAATGTVTHAGPLAGRGVVVLDHGRIRSTYEPVTATVAVGDQVQAGQRLGQLAQDASHCPPRACVHWGVRSDDRYLDPLAALRGPGVRLLPLADRALTGAPPPDGAGRPPPPGPSSPADPHASSALQWPLGAPRVTSAFGMRRHPITGVVKLHDGVDLGAACRTPVRAAASGRVSRVGPRGAYGLQVQVVHGRAAGGSVATSYSHLAAAHVRPGQQVRTGQTIGLVGSTGASTGCHLHFMVLADATPTDPVSWLPARRAQDRGDT